MPPPVWRSYSGLPVLASSAKKLPSVVPLKTRTDLDEFYLRRLLVMLTLALADLVGSAALTALTVTCDGEGLVLGAV